MIKTIEEVRPLNTFPEGSEVVFKGVGAISYAKVVHVSDCGVTIVGTFADGTPLGPSYVVSGASPAKPWKAVAAPSGGNTANPIVEVKVRAKRGSLSSKPISAPAKEKFTAREVAEHSNVPYPYALKWVEANCVACGVAETSGKGKKPTLYKLS